MIHAPTLPCANGLKPFSRSTFQKKQIRLQMRSIWANTILFILYYNIQMLIDVALQSTSREKRHKKASGFIFWASNFGISHLRVLPFIRAAQSIENLCFIAISTCAMGVSQINASTATHCNQCIIISHTLHNNVCMELHGALVLTDSCHLWKCWRLRSVVGKIRRESLKGCP